MDREGTRLEVAPEQPASFGTASKGVDRGSRGHQSQLPAQKSPLSGLTVIHIDTAISGVLKLFDQPHSSQLEIDPLQRFSIFTRKPNIQGPADSVGSMCFYQAHPSQNQHSAGTHKVGEILSSSLG